MFQDVRKTARRGQDRAPYFHKIAGEWRVKYCTPKYCTNFEDRLGCIYMSEFLKAPMSHLNPGLVVRFPRVLSIMAGEGRPGITKVDGFVPSGVQRPRVVLQIEDRSLLKSWYSEVDPQDIYDPVKDSRSCKMVITEIVTIFSGEYGWPGKLKSSDRASFGG